MTTVNASNNRILKPTLLGAGLGAATGAAMEYIGQRSALAQPDKYLASAMQMQKSVKNMPAFFQKHVAKTVQAVKDLIASGKLNKSMIGKAALQGALFVGGVSLLIAGIKACFAKK